MTEQQIKDGFARIEGALAAPVDALERVDRRVRVRRRRRRAAVVGAVAAVAVASVGTAFALVGDDDTDGSDLVATDPGPDPLMLTRPDGSTFTFGEVTVTCKPIKGGGERIVASSPADIVDERATEPFVYFEGIVEKIEGDRTFTFPNDWSTPSDEYPMVLFVADTDGNEAASSAGGESGTVRVLEASCDPTPVLRFDADMTLGSEVGAQSLDVAGELR